MTKKKTLFHLMRGIISHKNAAGKKRAVETYQTTLNSLIKFLNNKDIPLSKIDGDFVMRFEASLRNRGLCKNTTSFYLRILRTALNIAHEQGIVKLPVNLFKSAYTGIDATQKRAITIENIRQIRNLDLSNNYALNFARNIFMLSFYLRGMSFIDMAYLKKSDVSGGTLTYIRHKTGQRLTIRWESCMQSIVDLYSHRCIKPYLLPIITNSHKDPRRQYQNMLAKVNRNLAKIANMIGVTELTMYVARHSWASIAQSENIPLNIISSGMGHTSENTTRIYLAFICTEAVDSANAQILNKLDFS